MRGRVLAVIVLWGLGRAAAASPAISVDLASILFGDQRLDSPSAAQTITVSNRGTSDLHLDGAALGGAARDDFLLSTPPLPAPIGPGASVAIDVRFAPLEAGVRFAELLLASDDPASPSVRVSLSGAGTVPAAAMGSNPVDFGAVRLGSTARRDLLVTNAGTGAVAVAAPTLSGSDRTLFTVAPSGPFIVPPGGARTITIEFAPLAVTDVTAELSVSTDDPSLRTTIISLSGRGTAPVLAVSRPSLEFGAVTLGARGVSLPLTLGNAGDQQLVVSSLVQRGTDRADFLVHALPALPLVLAPGEMLATEIAFVPTRAGSESATLDIGTNDPMTPVLTVRMSGFGQRAGIEITPRQLDFGALLVGRESAPLPLSVRNSGDGTLHVRELRLVGALDVPFAVTPAEGFDLEPGTSRELAVRFAPLVSGSARASLEVIPDDFGVRVEGIGLVGEGVSAGFEARPGDLDFGPVSVGETSRPVMVEAVNHGDPQTLVRIVPTDPRFRVEPALPNLWLGREDAARFGVVFAPNRVDDRAATIELFVEASSVPVLSVPVRARGVAPRPGGCALGGPARVGGAGLGLLFLFAWGRYLRSRGGAAAPSSISTKTP